MLSRKPFGALPDGFSITFRWQFVEVQIAIGVDVIPQTPKDQDGG